MEFFTKLSISILTSMFKKFAIYTYEELQKNPKFFEFLAEHKLTKPKDKFESLYFFTLMRFSEKVSNKVLLILFKHVSVISAFKETLRTKTNAFERTLNKVLLTDQEICKIHKLKEFSKVPENDIKSFLDIYNLLSTDIKTPLQLETSNKLDNLDKKVSKINDKIDKLTTLSNTNEAILVIQNLINNNKKLIFDELMFSITLDLLSRIEDIISSISFSYEQQNKLLSQINYLKGWGLLFLNNPDNQLKFIQAYELSPGTKEYKEMACVAYYKKELIEKARDTANEILESDSLNPKACSVLKVLDSNFDVPKSVTNQNTFKYYYVNLLIRNSTTIDRTNDLIGADVESNLPFKYITSIEDFLFKKLFLTLYFENFLNKTFSFQTFITEYTKISSLQIDPYIDSFFQILTYCKKSKEFNQIHLFTEANWLFHFCVFLKYFDNKSATELFHSFQLITNKSNEFFYENTMRALVQTKQYNLIIELGTKYPTPNKALNINIADAILHTNGDKNRCNSLIREYCESFNIIDSVIAHNLVLCLELYKVLDMDPFELYLATVSFKEFESETTQKLLELYSKVLKGICVDPGNTYLVELSKSKQKLDRTNKDLLCILLHHVKAFSECNDFISSIEGHKESPLILKIYIDNLINLNDKSELIFDLLSKFRMYEINPQFLIYEIELFYRITDFETLLRLSQIGCSKFPDSSYFFYYKVIALYYLEKDTELLENLTESNFNKYKFGWQNAFFLAKICSEKGLNALGLEIVYDYTKENFDNSIVKDSYFSFYIFCCKQEPPVKFNKIEIDTHVRFKLNNDKKVKHITKSLVKNGIYQKFLGKEVGNSFSVRDKIGEELINIEILEITDKYRGLFLKITDEIHNDPYSGSHIIPIEIQGEDIDELKNILIKKFGAQGGIDNRLQKEQIEAYKNWKITFTELVRSFSNNKIFDVYYQLRNIERTFIVPPLKSFESIQTDNLTVCVLDIPTILLFNDLSEALDLHFEHKFTISNLVKEYFKIILKEEKNELKSNFSMDILEDSIRFIKHPENQKEIRINKLETIINWIDKNCIIGYSKSKLAFFDQIQHHDNGFDAFYWEYIMDTIFLANQKNGYLITDDYFFYTSFNGAIVPISTEYYLLKNLNMNSTIYSKLIEFNYIGLTISSDQLRIEYEKNPILESPNNTFLNAVRSLDFFYSRTKDNYNQAISFIKYIYSLSMDIKLKKAISQMVLQNVIINYPISIEDMEHLPNKIRKELHLLGNSDIEVLNDLDTVLTIRNLTHRKF